MHCERRIGDELVEISPGEAKYEGFGAMNGGINRRGYDLWALKGLVFISLNTFFLRLLIIAHQQILSSLLT